MQKRKRDRKEEGKKEREKKEKVTNIKSVSISVKTCNMSFNIKHSVTDTINQRAVITQSSINEVI